LQSARFVAAVAELGSFGESVRMSKATSTFKSTGLNLAGFFALVWLWRFGWAHWPAATDVVAYVAGGILAIVYAWKFFIVPFREGLTGSGDK